MAKAAVTRSIRDDHQKNFLKIFNGLTGKHSRWEIWEDFVTLTAIEISNSTDKVNATERTKMYQTIISKYSAKERDGMAEMLAEVVMGMEQNPDQDFLGSLYMMCELGNDHAGQFFTPTMCAAAWPRSRLTRSCTRTWRALSRYLTRPVELAPRCLPF